MSEPNDPAPPPAADALLQRVLGCLDEGVAVFDAGRRLTGWNDRAFEIAGIDPAHVHAGITLRELLILQARAGEFGAIDPEAGAEDYLAGLRDDVAFVTERVRANGHTIEVRRRPMPQGGVVVVLVDVTQRRAVEASLAERQRTLALLLERTEQGFWFIDNALRTTDANPAMCRMLGMTREQLLGRNIFEFVDDANAAIFRHHVALRGRGQATGYEITLRRADGVAVHCYNNATPIFDAEGHKLGAVGMFSDIGRLKLAEQRLRETGELLAQKSYVLGVTLDSLSQGVASFDSHGRTTAYNRRFLELLQVPEAFMASAPTIDEVRRYQVEHGLVSAELSRAEAEESRRNLMSVYQRRRADGMVIEVRTHRASDGGMVRTYTDVTATVNAQHALADSEARFRRMADAAPALIWESDREGNATWFNQRWLSYTGRSLAEELALPWPARMHADDLARCRAVFDAASASQSSYSVEFRVLRADGAPAWIADNGIPRVGAEGRFDGFVAYGWDITERKAAEAALRAAKDEAERANRAKSDFLSRMSHELRTPLNAVLGFGQVMDSDAADPLSAVQRTRVQELLRGGRHLLSLINDVLDLARIEAGTLHLELAAVDLAALADECMRLVRPMALAHGLDLSLGPAPDATAMALADATRLKQVLLNLLSNAIKYNRRGGSVELCWSCEGDVVSIEVRDTGPGLDEAQQAQLFQAFERLDAERTTVEGAGIGLALSKWLVELMRGRIGVRSVRGQGSVFWVCLARAGEVPPAADLAPSASASASAFAPAADARAAAAPADALSGTAPAVRRRVLYIEDNEVNQLLMRGMLALRPQVDLAVASLPLEGLALAMAQAPELLLLDIQLPGMDGYAVLRELRRHAATSGVPVIAVSANALDSDRERAREAGFADYITKPIELSRLLALVDHWLAPPP